MRKNMNSEVSIEIMVLIFSKLPFSNLPTCRQVCKAWNHVLLSSARFIASTSNHFLAHFSADGNFNSVHFDDDKYSQGFGIVASLTLPPTFSSNTLKILGSCNGLLFCKPRFNIPPLGKFILNPMTNECLELPKTRKHNRKIHSSVEYYYGFGFSTKTNQYKVVRCSVIKSTTKVKILAFGTVTPSSTSPPRWTRVAALPFRLDRHGTYCNGALYWPPQLIRAPLVYRFDVEEEKFEEFPFPIVGRYDDYYYGMQAFHGSFYLTLFEPKPCRFDYSQYQVLKMNQDRSWTNVPFVVMPQLMVPNEDFSLVGYLFRSGDLRLIKTYEDGKVLCFQIGFDLLVSEPQTGKRFVYQPRTGKRFLDELGTENSHKDVLYQMDSFNFNPLHKILAGDA